MKKFKDNFPEKSHAYSGAEKELHRSVQMREKEVDRWSLTHGRERSHWDLGDRPEGSVT